MTPNEIADVIKKVPTLNTFGFGLYEHGRGLMVNEQEAKLKRDQQELIESDAICTKICEWLSTKAKIKTINRNWSSYSLKHVAEREIGYITNGAFIAAAIHCGFPYKLKGANAYFGISQKSITLEAKREIASHA